MSYSEKKKTIRCAITGSIEKAQQIGIIEPDRDKYLNRSLLYCLKQNLKPGKVRRFAGTLADISKHSAGTGPVTADLYLKADNIVDGYNAVLDAVNLLINKSHYPDALELLDRLERLCIKKSKFDKLKIALMARADTEKMIGEINQAEKTYLRIINLYENQAADKLLAETYKDLGDLYKIRQDFESGIKALKKAEIIYSELEDDLELSHTLNNIGNILVRDRQYDSAFDNYRRALKIQRQLNSLSDVASTLNNMSLIYMNRGRLQRVLRLFRLSLQLNRELGNGVEIARLLNNLGCIYNELGQFDISQNHLLEALSINQRLGIKKELLFNLDNLSQVMLSSGQLKKTLSYLRQGIDLAGELSDLPHTAFMTLSMANTLKRMGFYGQAYDKTQEAIILGERVSDENHPSACLINLADLYIRLNAGNKARDTIQKIFGLADEYNDRRALLAAYSLSGTLEKDYEMLEKAIKLADELKLTRKKTLIEASRLKIMLEQDNLDMPGDAIADIGFYGETENYDVETAGILNVLSQYYSSIDEPIKAREIMERSLEMATRLSLLPEKIDAAIVLGNIYSGSGEFESAFQYYRKAMKSLKIIADDIKDEMLKKSFLDNDRIISLSEEIKKLQSVLTAKSKAGI